MPQSNKKYLLSAIPIVSKKPGLTALRPSTNMASEGFCVLPRVTNALHDLGPPFVVHTTTPIEFATSENHGHYLYVRRLEGVSQE